MTHSIVVLLTVSSLSGEPLGVDDKHLDQYAMMEDVKKKKKKR